MKFYRSAPTYESAASSGDESIGNVNAEHPFLSHSLSLGGLVQTRRSSHDSSASSQTFDTTPSANVQVSEVALLVSSLTILLRMFRGDVGEFLCIIKA